MDKIIPFGIDFTNENYSDNAVYGLVAVFSLIEKEIESSLKPFNLSISKFNILMIIKHQGGENGLSQIDIGKRLIVTASNMTKMLDKLYSDGFIERVPQTKDRRVNLIKITPKGSELLDKAWVDYSVKIQKITSLIDDKELKSFSGTLLKWFNCLNTGMR